MQEVTSCFNAGKEENVFSFISSPHSFFPPLFPSPQLRGFFSSSKSHLCSGSVAGAQSDDNRLDRLQTIQNTTLQLLRLFVLDLKARKTLIAVKYLHIYI